MEQLIILGGGAIRVSARELYNEIKGVETSIREKYINKRPPKNNLLTDNVDEKTREWIEMMRRQK